MDISLSIPYALSKDVLSDESSSNISLSVPLTSTEQVLTSPVTGSSLPSSKSEDSESQSLEDISINNDAAALISSDETAEHMEVGSQSVLTYYTDGNSPLLQEADFADTSSLFKLVFDNIDKTIKPREMRSNTPAKSLH